MHFPGMAWLFLLWLSNGARIVKEAKSVALESCPASRRGCLGLHMGARAGRDCGHYSGATCRGSVPGITSPASLAAPFALGWLQAVDATPFNPG